MATKAKKSGGRKKRKTATAADKRTFGGKVYTKKACSKTKTGAKQTADAARKSGSNARVVKTAGSGYCVFVRSSR